MDRMDNEARACRVDTQGLSQAYGSSEAAEAKGIRYAVESVLEHPTWLAFGVIGLGWVAILAATLTL
jgi:hypothetical protein